MEKRLTKEEFLKDLWHTASEKPNIKQGECCVTCLVKFKNESTELCVYFRNPEGWICPRCGKVNAPWVMQCSCNRDTQILPKVGAPYYEGDQATCNTKERK